MRGCTGDDVENATWHDIDAGTVPTNYARFVDAVRTGKNAEPSFRHAADLQKVLQSPDASPDLQSAAAFLLSNETWRDATDVGQGLELQATALSMHRCYRRRHATCPRRFPRGPGTAMTSARRQIADSGQAYSSDDRIEIVRRLGEAAKLIVPG